MANDEYGDFQTPTALAEQIFQLVDGESFSKILEPTCGLGVFLKVASEMSPSSERFGLELQEEYCEVASEFGSVLQGDALTFNFRSEIKWQNENPLLIIGNPPWVTNAELTSMGSTNKPETNNIRNLSGLDAITGSSNFDIAEFILIRLIEQFQGTETKLAFLCKTQVVRNLLSYCSQKKLNFGEVEVFKIDAQLWFEASVDACVFVASINPSLGSDYKAIVFDELDRNSQNKTIGIIQGKLVSNIENYEIVSSIDGASPVTWRQGIKHDASAVMELVTGTTLSTKTGVEVDIEPEYVYPLLKCTDVYRGRTLVNSKSMIVPQQHTGENTAFLSTIAPKLYNYLSANSEALDSRKSSIYKNRSRFCIFGVGEYSFLPYKVAISAMHKEPIFQLVGPINQKPVVFDDVCYFTSFENPLEASITAALLQSSESLSFIDSISFKDSKRPITKKLLQRIDLIQLASSCNKEQICQSSSTLLEQIGIKVEISSVQEAFQMLQNKWASQQNITLI